MGFGRGSFIEHTIAVSSLYVRRICLKLILLNKRNVLGVVTIDSNTLNSLKK